MIDYKSLIKLLDEKNISYLLYNHLPLFTVDDSKKLRGNINGAHTKNLFLKTKKRQFYLFSCLESTKIDLKLLTAAGLNLKQFIILQVKNIYMNC